jgi:hypothetical protein
LARMETRRARYVAGSGRGLLRRPLITVTSYGMSACAGARVIEQMPDCSPISPSHIIGPVRYEFVTSNSVGLDRSPFIVVLYLRNEVFYPFF